jgi:hypothetical protein
LVSEYLPQQEHHRFTQESTLLPQKTRQFTPASLVKSSLPTFKEQIGYTLTIKNNNIEISYSHISPNYLFKTGDIVSQKNIIAYVGPKNVYGVPNNPYTDYSGTPTNRSNNTDVIST